MTDVHVLLFGEGDSDYDRQAIEQIIKGISPKNIKLHCARHRRPLILDKNANRKKHKNVSAEIAVRERALRRTCKPNQRVVVIAFHDCDDVEPAHIKQAQDIRRDLEAAGVVRAVAATPAWCIEAWWLLFPEAVHATRKCWKKIKTPANVGAVVSAKDFFRRSVRPSPQGACPDYEERDSPAIARNVREMSLLTDANISKCASLKQFRDDYLSAVS